mmetsp:Transcript_95581/g.175160  ORF Transcript_95581/g.175160 Transcript_95581/m.175160 type:complete len:224 (+) Transcript_95581:225-896(+)
MRAIRGDQAPDTNKKKQYTGSYQTQSSASTRVFPDRISHDTNVLLSKVRHVYRGLRLILSILYQSISLTSRVHLVSQILFCHWELIFGSPVWYVFDLVGRPMRPALNKIHAKFSMLGLCRQRSMNRWWWTLCVAHRQISCLVLEDQTSFCKLDGPRVGVGIIIYARPLFQVVILILIEHAVNDNRCPGVEDLCFVKFSRFLIHPTVREDQLIENILLEGVHRH